MQTSKNECKINQNYDIDFKILEISKKSILVKVTILKGEEIQAERNTASLYEGETIRVRFDRTIDCSINFNLG